MTRVFVDTSALLTLLDRADPRHQAARVTFEELAEDDLETHGYVVAESLAVARRRFGVDGAIALLDNLLPALHVRAVEEGVHTAATARYRGSLPSGTSFVDMVSIEFMGRESITRAFVFDTDFAALGIEVIPALT